MFIPMNIIMEIRSISMSMSMFTAMSIFIQAPPVMKMKNMTLPEVTPPYITALTITFIRDMKMRPMTISMSDIQ